MKKHVACIYAKSFDIVEYYDDITHNTWVHLGMNITLRLVYNKNGKYRLVDTSEKDVGYLKKADGKVIFHTVTHGDIELSPQRMQVYLAVVVVEEDGGPDEEKILKVGHYLWEYYVTRSNEAGELRVKLQNIRLEEGEYDTKYVVFIKYKEKWKSNAEITYHSETKPDHSEGYQLKL
jgi:hypothetical protein